METYFKLKMITEYIIPLSIIGLIILLFVTIIFCGIIQNWINKRRNRKDKQDGYISMSVIDEIKAEIETDLSWFCFDDWGNESSAWIEIKKIIDKHCGKDNV